MEARLVCILHEAGVPVLAGTDAGEPYALFGASLHDEPPLTGVSVLWCEPGETAPALRTALGNADRAPVR